ncbi:hypothetical protein V8B97DRAFT_1870297, partial [Scleroderma yunnanense]
ISIRAAIDRILKLPDLVGVHAKPSLRDDVIGYDGTSYGHDTNHQNSLEGPTSTLGDFCDRGYVETGDTNDIFAYNPPKESPALVSNYHSSPLPRSSPWTSDSPIMECDTILDFDTSPGAPPSPITEWSDDQSMNFDRHMHTASRIPPRRINPGTASRRNEHSILSRHAFHNRTSEDSSHSSSVISLHPFSLKPVSPKLRLSDRFPPQVQLSPEPVEERSKIAVPSDLPLDFIADPDPWTTIGRILELEPPLEPSSTSFRDEQLVSYTKGREGVGYKQDERSSSNPASMSTVSSWKNVKSESIQHSVHGSSSPLRPTTITSSPCSDFHKIIYNRWQGADVSRRNFSSPSFSGALCSPSQNRSSSRAELDGDEREGEYDNDTGAVGTFDTDSSQGQFKSLDSRHQMSEIIEVDVEMCFDGPCLFGDADFDDE